MANSNSIFRLMGFPLMGGVFGDRRVFTLLTIGIGIGVMGAIPAPLAAEEPLNTPALTAHLDALIDNSTAVDEDNGTAPALDVITSHYNAIITQPDLTIRAMILARQSGDLNLALRLGADGLDQLTRGHDAEGHLDADTPRLLYELAYTLLLAGDCQRARPLFQMLVHDGFIAPYWIKLESQKGLLLCPDGIRWFGDMTVEFSHDDNLAGLTPQQSITPQPGSALAEIINVLGSVIDLPEHVVLGTPPQDGYWLALHPRIWRYWRQSNAVMTARFMPSIRITSPMGYEHLSLSGQFSRHRIYEASTGIQMLEVYRNLRQHGNDQGETEDIGATLFTGMEWQWRYPVLVGGIIGQGRSTSGESKTQIQHYGYRLAARSGIDPDAPHLKDALRWSLTFQSLTQDSDPILNASDSQSLSGSLGSFEIGPLDDVSFEWTVRRQRPHHPRPWLQHRHTRKDYILGMTSRHQIRDHVVDIIIKHHRIRSEDPLDPKTNLQVMIRFH